MGPSNDNELTIARIVDRIDIDGRLDPGVMDEIIVGLRFVPSEADCDFLERYIQWRMANPIQK
jgi:hypothetical protein